MLSLLRQVLDEEQANLIFCMFISIPISYLLKLLHQKFLFLALSLTVTLAFQSFLFPTECHFLWAQQQIVYALVFFAPRKYVGHVVLVESFMALAFVQIRRIYIAYGQNGVDITGIFMMQLFVWVGMGYNYQNGGADQTTLTHDQKRRMIKQTPNYLTYIGYVNFLPACLIGPVYEYRDYEDYLNRVQDYVHIPSPLLAMAKQALVFTISLTVYFATAAFKIQDLLTAEYASYSLWYKFIYIYLIIFSTEFKYISAWSLGMISMKASGFTYNPGLNCTRADGVVEYNFDKVRVTDFGKFFFSSTLKVKAEGWNISVQVALKKYIYELVYNQTKTYHSEKQRIKTMNKAMLITMLTSGLWHGFYPAYFITFFHWGLCLTISGQFWKFRTRHKGMKALWEKYRALEWIENFMWQYAIAYFGAAVPLLLWEKVRVYLAETYYIPYVILYVSVVMVWMNFLGQILAKSEGRSEGKRSDEKKGEQSKREETGQALRVKDV